METNLAKTIAEAQARAVKIVEDTADIRGVFKNGRPNTSTESTVAGTLAALVTILGHVGEK